MKITPDSSSIFSLRVNIEPEGTNKTIRGVRSYSKITATIMQLIGLGSKIKELNYDGKIYYVNKNSYIKRGSPNFQQETENKTFVDRNVLSIKSTLAPYQGERVDGKRHGQGKMTYLDGATYEGTWQNDLRHGKGVYTFASGKRYEGNYVNDHREGEGVMKYEDGSEFTGNWAKDLREGQGVYVQKGVGIYEGTYKADLRNGPGKFTFLNGIVFEGTWKDDVGTGKYIYPDGTEVPGKFQNIPPEQPKNDL
jgi:hypothetical protein